MDFCSSASVTSCCDFWFGGRGGRPLSLPLSGPEVPTEIALGFLRRWRSAETDAIERSAPGNIHAGSFAKRFEQIY